MNHAFSRSSPTAAVAVAILVLTSCASQGTGGVSASTPTRSSRPGSAASSPASTPADAQAAGGVNIYAGAGAGQLSATARLAKSLVYVPNTRANTVQVIDPKTFRVIATYPTGREPQHVVPSWDMKTLWVNDDLGNNLVPIDPITAKPGTPVHVKDPYNLYFTPDGSHALVMAERLHRIDVRDPHTMALQRSLPVPCSGLNHADYAADLSFLVASCEFSGKLLVFDRNATKVVKVIDLNSVKTAGATSVGEAMRMGGPTSSLRPGASAMPQDVRLTPDGTRFLVADMLRNGIWVISAATQDVERFIPTGLGAHGIYPDRAGKRIFVSNRGGAPSRCWTPRRWPSPPPGGSPAAGRPTWAGSARTGYSCGSPAGTTTRSTSSTPPAVS